MSWTIPTLYTPGSPATPPATSTDWQAFLTTNLAALMPIGAYMYMHSSPTRAENLVNNCYLECNGSAVSRTTYASLFSAIGTTYGSGDGSTTFNLPDAAGRLLLGASGTGGHADNTALGSTDGTALSARAAYHYHTFSESAHNHTGNTGTSGTESVAHQHTAVIPAQVDTADDFPLTTNAVSSFNTVSTSLADSHTHAGTGFSIAGTTGDVSVDIGGSRPVDTPSYICAGTLFIRAL